jgi:hypothetical protein
MARKGKGANPPKTESYKHPTAETLLRPEVGTQAQFKKKKTSCHLPVRFLPRSLHVLG